MLLEMEPFRESIKISSICNEVFQIMFLKPDTGSIIQRQKGTKWETASLLKLLNGWRTLAEQVTM